MKKLILVCSGLLISALTYAQIPNSKIAVTLGDDQRSVVIMLHHPEPLATDIYLLETNGETIVEKHFNPRKAQQLTINCRDLSDGLYTIAVSMDDLIVKYKLQILKGKLFIDSGQSDFCAFPAYLSKQSGSSPG